MGPFETPLIQFCSSSRKLIDFFFFFLKSSSFLLLVFVVFFLPTGCRAAKITAIKSDNKPVSLVYRENVQICKAITVPLAGDAQNDIAPRDISLPG